MNCEWESTLVLLEKLFLVVFCDSVNTVCFFVTVLSTPAVMDVGILWDKAAMLSVAMKERPCPVC